MKIMKATFVWVIGVVAMVGLAWIFTRTSSGKHGFIVNQRIFDEYRGKKRLEQQLGVIRKKHANSIDSLRATIGVGRDLNLELEQLKAEFQLQEELLSEKFTADIWSEINRSIERFGKEKGYDFIYGATGNGSLMFANSSGDVTKDMIEYINESYAGE